MSLITEQPKLSTDRVSIYFVLFYSIVNYFNLASHFALRTSTPEIDRNIDFAKSMEEYINSWKIRISISS